MPRPKILRETRHVPEEREPPARSLLRAHAWLSEESLGMYEALLYSGRPFPIYISEVAEAKMREHALKEAPKELEVMGFMLGDVLTWKGVPYVICRDVVTTRLRSTSSKVKFSPDAFPELFLQLDGSGFDYILVGWYHSHPGHTCFLSRTDLETQRSMFEQPFHTALVIDPVNRDVRTFRLTNQDPGYHEVPFALYSPDIGPSRRTRKLKVRPVPAQ